MASLQDVWGDFPTGTDANASLLAPSKRPLPQRNYDVDDVENIMGMYSPYDDQPAKKAQSTSAPSRTEQVRRAQQAAQRKAKNALGGQGGQGNQNNETGVPVGIASFDPHGGSFSSQPASLETVQGIQGTPPALDALADASEEGGMCFRPNAPRRTSHRISRSPSQSPPTPYRDPESRAFHAFRPHVQQQHANETQETELEEGEQDPREYEAEEEAEAELRRAIRREQEEQEQQQERQPSSKGFSFPDLSATSYLLEVVLYVITGVLLVFVMEQFIQIGVHIGAASAGPSFRGGMY